LDVAFGSSVLFGDAYVLENLWRHLRIDQIAARSSKPKGGRRRDMPTIERVPFAPAANRAPAPSTKRRPGRIRRTRVQSSDGLPET
jgi:hypothetical protein